METNLKSEAFRHVAQVQVGDAEDELELGGVGGVRLDEGEERLHGAALQRGVLVQPVFYLVVDLRCFLASQLLAVM